ncbi:MAG: A24 family peptidase [Alphaproteobacteria bacterium]|nr:A24 family peptidase [Alphaproteobacteria bacterium]
MEYLILSPLLGAILASFAISLSEHSISSLWRFSVCDSCDHPLKVKQLVPIFSSFLKTICRCGHRPSLKYGILEALLAFAFFINTLTFGTTPFGILLNAFTMINFYISLVDWKTLHVPLSSLILLAVLSGLWSYFNGQIPISVFIMFNGTILFYFAWKLIKGTRPMGTADMFLFTLSGFWLPLDFIPLFLFLAGLGGVIISKIFKRKDKKFPFSPAILLSLWFTILTVIYF